MARAFLLVVVFAFPHLVIASYLLFVVRYVITFGILFLVAACIQVVAGVRAGAMSGHLLILHVILTSASFHNSRLEKGIKKWCQFYSRGGKKKVSLNAYNLLYTNYKSPK